MFIYIIGAAVLGFWAGWVCKDRRWTKAAKNNVYMFVDGDLYKVEKHVNDISTRMGA